MTAKPATAAVIPGSMRPLLEDAAGRAALHLERLADRPVFPRDEDLAGLAALSEFRDAPRPPAEVLALLDRHGSPATIASPGGRYHGYVIGGALPSAVAAHVLATAWDQNGAYWSTSPVVAHVEEVTLARLVGLLSLPAGTGGGFTTGASMATFCGMAAARHELLARAGWDVERDGLVGAPRVRVVASAESHPSIHKSAGLLGLGRGKVESVATDAQGRMKPSDLPELDGRTIVCAQAGNVNTGACDPFDALADRASAAGAWLHVDGAFGLWAAAVPSLSHLVRGVQRADSWAVDGHKWLNVPYDCGIALTRHPEALRAAMRMSAAYLPAAGRREPTDFVPEQSRRARAVDVWAALQELGRDGLVRLVGSGCRHARAYADALRAAGAEVLNDVVLNQVLVSFGSDERTRAAIERLQRDGTVWCGGTVWQGRAAMRISVSSWATSEDDVRRGIAAILRAAGLPARAA